MIINKTFRLPSQRSDLQTTQVTKPKAEQQRLAADGHYYTSRHVNFLDDVSDLGGGSSRSTGTQWRPAHDQWRTTTSCCGCQLLELTRDEFPSTGA